MADPRVQVEIGADTGGLRRGVRDAERQLRGLDRAVGDIGRRGRGAFDPVSRGAADAARQARALQQAAGGAAGGIQTIARQATTALPALTGLGGGLSQIMGLATRFGPLAAVVTGLFATFRTGEPALRETERAMRSVAVSLQGVGVNFRGVEGEVERTIGRLERLTGISDADLARAFSRLVQITGNYRASLDGVETVADLAAARQTSLKEAAEVVGRALAGETQSLRRYGIALREGATQAEVLAGIQASVGGQARANLEAADRLTVAWENFAKAIASRVKPVTDAFRHSLAATLDVVTDTLAEDPIEVLRAASERQALSLRGFRREPGETQAEFAQRVEAAMAEQRARIERQIIGARRFREADLDAQGGAAFDPAAKIFEDMEAAMAKAARQAAFLGGEEARLKGQIDAAETALKTFAEQGLSPTNALAQEAKDRLTALRLELERLTVAAEVGALNAGRQTPTEREARAQTEALREARARAAAGQAQIDAVFAQMAEEQQAADEAGLQAWIDLQDRRAAEAERAADRVFRANRDAADKTERAWARTGDRVVDVLEAVARGGTAGDALRGAAQSFASEFLRAQVRGVLARGAGLPAPTGGGLNLGSLFNLGGLFGGGAGGATQAALPNAGIELGAGLQGAGAGAGASGVAAALPVVGIVAAGAAFAISRSRSRRARRRAQLEALRAEFAPTAAGARAIEREGLVALTGQAAASVLRIESIRGLGDRAGAESARAFLDQWTRIANPLSQGIQGGLAAGIRGFLTRDGATLRALREGVRTTLVEAITQATLQGAVVKGAFGSLLGRLTEGLARGQDVTGLLPQIAGLLPALAAQLEALLAPLRAALEAAIPRGSFQSGTPYVPETGTYRLHKGEAVIPAGARAAGGGPVHLHVHVGAREVAHEIIDDVVDLIPMRSRFRYGTA